MEIHSANLKALNVNDEDVVKDGEKIDISIKDLGSADIYPLVLNFNYFLKN